MEIRLLFAWEAFIHCERGAATVNAGSVLRFVDAICSMAPRLPSRRLRCPVALSGKFRVMSDSITLTKDAGGLTLAADQAGTPFTVTAERIAGVEDDIVLTRTKRPLLKNFKSGPQFAPGDLVRVRDAMDLGEPWRSCAELRERVIARYASSEE